MPVFVCTVYTALECDEIGLSRLLVLIHVIVVRVKIKFTKPNHILMLQLIERNDQPISLCSSPCTFWLQQSVCFTHYIEVWWQSTSYMHNFESWICYINASSCGLILLLKQQEDHPKVNQNTTEYRINNVSSITGLHVDQSHFNILLAQLCINMHLDNILRKHVDDANIKGQY